MTAILFKLSCKVRGLNEWIILTGSNEGRSLCTSVHLSHVIFISREVTGYQSNQ